MCRELLDDYARLLTVDTRACAELFTRDAEFRTRFGPLDLHLCGRHEIESFIAHVPRQMTFRAAECRIDGTGYQGEILVLPDGLPPRTQDVRYEVESGRFTRFHVVKTR